MVAIANVTRKILASCQVVRASYFWNAIYFSLNYYYIAVLYAFK